MANRFIRFTTCFALLLSVTSITGLTAQVTLPREPAGWIDTNRVVYDSVGKPLRYYQYFPIMQTGDYYLSKNYDSPDSRITVKKNGAFWKENGLSPAMAQVREDIDSMMAQNARDPNYKKPFWGRACCRRIRS